MASAHAILVAARMIFRDLSMDLGLLQSCIRVSVSQRNSAHPLKDGRVPSSGQQRLTSFPLTTPKSH